MRITSPKQAALIKPEAHPLVFTGQQGERFQISVLDHDLIRVQHLPDGQLRLNRTWLVVGSDGETPREGRRRDDLSPFPLPGFTLETNGDALQLRTASLTLTIHTGNFYLRWADSRGHTFASDLRARPYEYDRGGRTIYHYMERRPGECYYGFGEKAGLLDKAGQRLRLCNVDALGYDAASSDPLYKHFPFYITFVPELNLAYGLLYDNLATTTFDLGKEVNALRGAAYRYYQADDGDLDYYLMYGPTIEAVLEKLARLTGYPALPPRWTLGYLGSTMSYTEAPDAQEQLKQFVDLCRAHDIPCDMFHLSSGYTTDELGRRCVFTWNRSKVPDPPTMVEYFHQAGIRLAANIKPYLLKTHPDYERLKAQGGFVRAADADEPATHEFWSGGLFQYADGSYVDFTHGAGYDWWKAGVTNALLAYGIDAIWNDNNEFEIWDDQARCAGFGDALPVGLARPLLTLLMARASYEAMQAYRPDQRPFLLTRAACPGAQRYAQTWSGDNETSWHTLHYNIPMGLSLSLSGMPNTGHDVGGFFGPKPDPELFVRWVQNGIFHPRFAIHSWNIDGTVNEPWMYPEALPLVREAIALRYRLLPYLYTLLFEAAQTGRPIIRPLVYHFPRDARCHRESFDFMLGPNLLVASVVEPGARSRAIYLPMDTHWCDFYTGQWYTGGQTIEVEAPLERIPLLAPAGGILPMGKVMRYVGEQPDDVRQAFVFPAPEGGRSVFTLIEDDGVSLAYRRGESAAVTLEVEATPERITLSTPSVRGNYPLPYREIEFVLLPGENRPVQTAMDSYTRTDEYGRRRIAVAVEHP